MVLLPTLHDIVIVDKTDGVFLVGDGTDWVGESGATARTSLGLGTISTQAASAVAIAGGNMDSTIIGAVTPAAGTFTALVGTTVVSTDETNTITLSNDFAGTLAALTTNSGRTLYIRPGATTLLGLSATECILYSDKAYRFGEGGSNYGKIQYVSATDVFEMSTVGAGSISITTAILCGETIYFGTKQTYTPNAGNSDTLTMDLATYQHPELDCSASTGACTITLTPPLGTGAGTFALIQDDPARAITWAVTGGTIKWLGSAPGVGDTASYYRVISYKWDGAIMFLTMTDEGA